MATPPNPRLLVFLQIDPPPDAGSGDALVNDQGLTLVRLCNGDPSEAYTAWIVDDPTGSGGNITGSGSLQQIAAGSTQFTAMIAVGSFSATPPGSPNRYVWVQDSSQTGSQGQAFRAVYSSGSGSYGLRLAARTAAGVTAKATRPVPVAVQLRSEPPAEASDEGRPHIRLPTLVYSALIGSNGSWLSEPVPVAAGAEAAYWQLYKSDARRWELLLRQRDAALAAYGHVTPEDHDFSFPVRLTLESDSTNRCPSTIIVAAVP